jgi:neutral trehalase
LGRQRRRRDGSFSEDVTLAAATHRPPEEIYRDIRAGAESGWDFSSRWFADARTMARSIRPKSSPSTSTHSHVRAGNASGPVANDGDHDAEDFPNGPRRAGAIDR